MEWKRRIENRFRKKVADETLVRERAKWPYVLGTIPQISQEMSPDVCGVQL